MTEPTTEPTERATAEPSTGPPIDLATIVVLGIIGVLGWFLGPVLKALFPESGMPALLSFPALLVTFGLYVGLIVAAVVGGSRPSVRLRNAGVGGLVVLTVALVVSWFLAPAV